MVRSTGYCAAFDRHSDFRVPFFCDEGGTVRRTLDRACRSRRLRSTLAESRKMRMSGPLATCDFVMGRILREPLGFREDRCVRM